MSEIIDKRFENIVFVKYRGNFYPVRGFEYEGQAISIDYTNLYGVKMLAYNVFLNEVEDVLNYDDYLVQTEKSYYHQNVNKQWLKILSSRLFNIGDKVLYQGRKFTIAKMEYKNSGWKYADSLDNSYSSYLYYQDELQLVYDFMVFKKKLQKLEI